MEVEVENLDRLPELPTFESSLCRQSKKWITGFNQHVAKEGRLGRTKISISSVNNCLEQLIEKPRVEPPTMFTNYRLRNF